MLNNPSPDTRELIVQCLQRMIATKVHNIKSGWKAVFVVLGIAARQSTPPLVHSAFELLEQIMDQYFALITESADTLDECVNCLVAFGCNALTDVAQAAIARLETVADFLAQQVVQQQQSGGPAAVSASRKLSAELLRVNYNPSADRAVAEHAAEDGASNAGSASGSPRPVPSTAHYSSLSSAGGLHGASTTGSSTASSGLRVWFLLLTGLSRLVGDQRLAVRSAALETLFAVLNRHGALFSAATWRHIFYGVLFPIFDDVKRFDALAGTEWVARRRPPPPLALSPLAALCGLCAVPTARVPQSPAAAACMPCVVVLTCALCAGRRCVRRRGSCRRSRSGEGGLSSGRRCAVRWDGRLREAATRSSRCGRCDARGGSVQGSRAPLTVLRRRWCWGGRGRRRRGRQRRVLAADDLLCGAADAG